MATDDAAALASELRDTTGRLIRRLRAEMGLPLAQVTVLGLLDRGGPQTVSALAASERVRPQSMAQTVHALETAGLVTRRPDPSDRRRALVEPTAAGRDALRASRRRRESWLARTLESELDARERAALGDAVALMRRIADG